MTRYPVLALLLLTACGSGDGTASDAAGTPPAAEPFPVTQATGAAPAAGDTSWTLRFDGAGPLRVGMSVEEARAALGGDFQAPGPDASAPAGELDQRCVYAQSARLPKGVMVMLDGGRVARIEVDSGTVASAEGARIGDTQASIERLYAGRLRVEGHKYVETGSNLVVRPADADSTRLMVFETDNGKVVRFRAGQRPQVDYVEGCS